MNDNKTLDKKRPIQGARRADEGPSEAERSCRLHYRRATRAGPHPALRATFSRARARAKGKCEANLAPMTPSPAKRPLAFGQRPSTRHENSSAGSYRRTGRSDEPNEAVTLVIGPGG